ncbi:amino acid permease, partial [candidate division KSB1 bacterium]|nr:amino acid permease [candidate division KSB1 bacterium]
MTENDGLRREIGVWGLASNSINIVIGACIFIMPAIVAERLGAASILAYAICGVLIMLIMLCFAEIGSKITITGGAYSYIEVVFGRYAGFLTTNIFIFGAAVMANAAVANLLADTVAYFFPAFKVQWVRGLFFITMFAGFAYWNVRGVKKGMLLVKFNTIAKLTPLLFIALFGWIWFTPSNLSWASTPSLLDLGDVSLILIFAFTGAETGLNVSGEIKNPKKTIPKGIMLSVLIVVVLYMLIQISAQGILGETL